VFYWQPWAQEPAERGDRKIIIPLNEASTSEEEEEGSTDQESEAESRSEVLHCKKKVSCCQGSIQAPFKRKAANRYGTVP
jgi:hypothetical protein